MTFSFRAKCKLDYGTYLACTEAALQLYGEGEERVWLDSIPQGESLAASDLLLLKGSGYSTQEDARVACDRWVSYLKTGFAGAAIGADFFTRAPGGGWTKYAIEAMEVETAKRILSDENDPLVFEAEPAPLFASVGPITARKGIPAGRVLNQIEHAVTAGVTMDASQRVAYELYSISFGLQSPDARFVMLVTAVEALIEQRPKSSGVCDLVADFKQRVRDAQIPDDERKSLLTALGLLELESINKAGKGVAAKLSSSYYSEAPDVFFSRCYRIRSDIVHGNMPRPSIEEVQIRAANLEIFVGHLLSAVVTGAEYISE